jgi:hypothetical protein
LIFVALLISEMILTAVIKLLSALSVLSSRKLSFFSLSDSSISGKVQVIIYLSPSCLFAQPSHF